MSASGIYLTRRQFWGMFVLTPALTFVAMIMLLVVMNRRSALAGAYAGGDDDAQVLREGRLLAEVRHIVRTRYVDDVEPDQLLYGALHGMVGSLDAVSEFMPPETYGEEKIDTLGRFGGLGIEVVLQDGWLTVLSPIEGTPAHKAGVLAGDRIVAIGGVSTEGFTVPDAAKRLRGKPGTSVTITVVHEGTKRRVDITIERAEIRVKTVRGARLLDTAQGIGYLRIAQFADATAAEFDTAVNELRTQGLKALVVDLRWNPGGLLRQGVGVADRFLASGAIVSVRSRAAAPEIYAAQAGTTTLPDLPVVVLVNGRSASSAEIVAGALQDHKRGVLVGARTYGKGTVQTILELEEGRSAVRITTARYYTPNGRTIEPSRGAKGLAPDIVVALTRAQRTAIRAYWVQADVVRRNGTPAPTPAPDPQLDRALAAARAALAAGGK
jgi:carboxyl-terminal processing protease